MVIGLLNAIRWKNILILFITQLLLYFKFIHNSIDTLNAKVSTLSFILLALVTCIICAAGNIINNYFDFEIDQHSLQKNNSILNKKQYLVIYLLLLFGGIIISLYLANKTGYYKSFLIYPFASFLLFLYSWKLKCVPLLGNLLISIFTGLVILLIPYAYWEELLELKFIDPNLWFNTIQSFIILFSFTTLLNLYREIIKDIEDQNADHTENCNSTAVYFGTKKSKLFALSSLTAFLIVSIAYIFSIKYGIYQLGFFICILLPSLFIVYLTYIAKEKIEFKKLSQYSKILMVLGLLFILFNLFY
jgi:4-hydroxybenzoate polyprenyltransferase